MNPITYLDLDGVLIDDEIWSPTAMAELNQLCHKTGAVIVLITSLRYSHTTVEQLHATMLQHGLDPAIPVSEVRDLSEWRAAVREGRRPNGFKRLTKGEEISAHLAAHPDVSRYVIIDDQPRGTSPHEDRTVAPVGAFSSEDRLRAMALLQSP